MVGLLMHKKVELMVELMVVYVLSQVLVDTVLHLVVVMINADY